MHGPKRSIVGVAAVAVVTALAGCAGPLGQGESAFRRGDYPTAKQLFGALQASAREWPPELRAEYALYRGLTWAALGDTVRADRWLARARALEESHPSSLSFDDRCRLEMALDAVDGAGSAAPSDP
jgi:hypothetical protein